MILMGKKSAAGTVAIVMLTILAASFWVFVLYSDWNRETGSYTIPIADHNVSKVEVITRSSAMGIEIGVLPTTSANIFQGDWEHVYSQFGQSDMIPENISFTNETVGDTLRITINAVSNGALNHMGISIWNMTLYLNANYINNLTVRNDAGSVEINLSKITLSQLNVATDAGSCEITLSNVILDNGLKVSTNAGSCDLTLVNVTLSNNASVMTDAGSLKLVMHNLVLTTNIGLDVQTNAGSNEIIWNQENTLGAKMDIRANTDAGSLDLTIRGSLTYLRYDITQTANVGSKSFVGGTQFTGSEGTYQSTNIADTTKDLITINAATDVGSNTITISA